MSDSCCNSTIEVKALHARHRRILATVLVINVVAFVIMVSGSVLSGSSALLSGTLDNFGDAVTYALSLAVVSASHSAKARVALVKGLLISAAAVGVAVQIGWNLLHPGPPVVEPMGIAAVLNLAANAFCLWLLTPQRHSDINMSSVWECSRNDVVEGFAVIAATIAVWALDSGWPDILVAIALLVMFSRSAARVLGSAWRELKSSPG